MLPSEVDARPVEAAEGSRRHGALELGTVGRQLRLEIVENFLGQTERLAPLDHRGWQRADENGSGCTAFAVTCQKGHDLAAAGGMADVHRVVQIEVLPPAARSSA